MIALVYESPKVADAAPVEAANPCQPLDVVFLVDQSSTPNGITNADPQGSRFDMVRAAIEFLGYESLSNCQGLPHRAAIISFDNSRVERDLGLTPLEPRAGEDWQARVAAITSDFRNRSGWEGRDYDLAFRAARSVLQDAPSLPGREARQLIFLITANYGAPYVKDTSSSYGPFEAEAVLRRSSFLNPAQLNFDPQTGPFVTVLAFTGSQPFEERITGVWRDFVSNYNGNYQLASAREPVALARALFQEITVHVAGNSPRFVSGNCGSIYVDSLTENLLILIAQNNKGADLIIEHLGGSRSINVNDGTFPGVQTLVTISAPEAGEWKIGGDDCDEFWFFATHNYYSDLKSNLVLDEIQSQCDRSKYACAPPPVILNLGVPISDGYLPIISANVQAPNGGNFPLTFDYQTNGTFISRGGIPAEQSGVHVLSLSIEVESIKPASNQSSQELVTLTQEYEVQPIVPFDMKISDPLNGNRIDIYSSIFRGATPQPVYVKVELIDEAGRDLTDAAGKPVSVAEVFKNSGQDLVQVELRNLDTGVAVTAFLQPSAVDPNALEVAIGDGLLEAGGYSVSILIDDKVSEGVGKGFGLIDRERTVDFRRVCSVFACPATIQTLFIASVALVFGTLMLGWYWNSNPVYGLLEFRGIGESRDFHIASIPLQGKFPRKQRVLLKDKGIADEWPTLSFIHSLTAKMSSRDEIQMRLVGEDTEIYQIVSVGEWVQISNGLKLRYIQDEDEYEDDSREGVIESPISDNLEEE